MENLQCASGCAWPTRIYPWKLCGSTHRSTSCCRFCGCEDVWSGVHVLQKSFGIRHSSEDAWRHFRFLPCWPSGWSGRSWGRWLSRVSRRPSQTAERVPRRNLYFLFFLNKTCLKQDDQKVMPQPTLRGKEGLICRYRSTSHQLKGNQKFMLKLMYKSCSKYETSFCDKYCLFTPILLITCLYNWILPTRSWSNHSLYNIYNFAISFSVVLTSK